MPQIIVVADSRAERPDQAVMFTERVTVSDFESGHFQTQLVERLGWAVGDAQVAEQRRTFTDSGQTSAWDEDDAADDGPEGRDVERELVSDAQPVS
jgi:hypothetical protein